MRFSEFVVNKENVCLQDVIPFLQLIYTYSHNWNADDSIRTVLDSKWKYVISRLLVPNINNKDIEGELVYEYICDDEGNPCAVDPETEEFATKLNLDKSYVNFNSLIKYIVNDIRVMSLITDELLMVAGKK